MGGRGVSAAADAGAAAPAGHPGGAPAGRASPRDADFGGLFCDPPNEGFRFCTEQYQRVLVLNGGDPAMARKLCRCFPAAGLPDPQLRMTQTMDTEPGGDTKLLALSTLDATAESITSAGLATPAEAEATRADLAAFIADPHTLVADPRIFSVWAHRPAA